MNTLNQIIITDITTVVSVISHKGRRDKMTNRKNYGLSFCTEGQITYILDGVEYVSDPAHAIILPKGQSYTLHGDETGMFALINFDCMSFQTDKFILLPTGNISSVMKNFEQMKNLFLLEENRLKTVSILYDIFHKLLSYGNDESDILFPALKYIEANSSSPDITNDLLADMCYISEVYLRKLFSRTYGVSPKQYVIGIRINKAKQMLTEGVLTVSAISEECGFSSPYHFSRLFKAKTGMSPTEYMEQNKIVKL